MSAVQAIIGLLTALIGLATAWLQFQKERQNRPRRDEQLPSQNQYPSARPQPLRGFGCRRVVLTIVGVILSLVGIVFFVSSFEPIIPSRTSPPITSPPTPTPNPSLNPNSSASPDTDFFTIVGSYLNQEEARVRADEIQKNNPDLNIQVFERYQNSSYYAVMAASWTSRATALEICRIARRRGIAQDAYVWSFSNSVIQCN